MLTCGTSGSPAASLRRFPLSTAQSYGGTKALGRIAASSASLRRPRTRKRRLTPTSREIPGACGCGTSTESASAPRVGNEAQGRNAFKPMTASETYLEERKILPATIDTHRLEFDSAPTPERIIERLGGDVMVEGRRFPNMRRSCCGFPTSTPTVSAHPGQRGFSQRRPMARSS